MKVFFVIVIALFLASVCAENNIDTPISETLMSDIQKPIVEVLAKDSPTVENVEVADTPVVTETLTEEKHVEISKDENSTDEENKGQARLEGQRIASGVDALAGENLDHAQLTIIFYNQMQTCGGILVHPQYVLTTASCVKDPVEGVASIVNVTFPQLASANVFTKLQIYIHEAYDQATYANNVALIKLSSRTVPDNKTLAVANYTSDITADLYVNKTLRLCGFGSIANYYTKPSKLRCTDLFIQPAANCSTVANTICAFWTDRDNNACNNDYGGALYLYSYSGLRINQTVVGMASFSPDYRPNAPCFGGQKVVSVQTSNYLVWINNIINQ